MSSNNSYVMRVRPKTTHMLLLNEITCSCDNIIVRFKTSRTGCTPMSRHVRICYDDWSVNYFPSGNV